MLNKFQGSAFGANVRAPPLHCRVSAGECSSAFQFATNMPDKLEVPPLNFTVRWRGGRLPKTSSE